MPTTNRRGVYQTVRCPDESRCWYDCPDHATLTPGNLDATLVISSMAWPELCPGWTSFNLNWEQHLQSLARLAALDAEIVGVGHGDPITEGAADKVHEVAARPAP